MAIDGVVTSLVGWLVVGWLVGHKRGLCLNGAS